MERKKAYKTVIGAVIFTAVSLVLLIGSFPYARDFMLYAESRAQFAQWIDSFGLLGPVVVLAIQILQIIIAFLPGEPVEVLAGMVCGPWGGLLLCLLGTFMGSGMVFFMVRKFGKPLVNLFFSDEQLYKYRFLRDERRLERLVFLVFFIPGTPKDILNYMAGLTKIRPMRFLIISTIARIPSIVTSTFAGDALSGGDFTEMIGFFAAAGLLALIGLHIHRRLSERMNREADTDEAQPNATETETARTPQDMSADADDHSIKQ